MKSENKFLKNAEQIVDELIEIRRHIHKNPEIGIHTIQTAEFVKKKLEEMGYKPEFVGEAGITATVGKSSGKVLLLRADMDALPMEEKSGLEFTSKVPGAAHCCGHDLHTAILLGAAKLLKEVESSLEGTVKLMFQPGEETMQGARNMIKNGILENPTVDAAIAIHVNSIVKSGRLLVFDGPTAASSDLFTIHIKGHGGHGARPEETIDPLNIASHILIALQELQARELKAGTVGVVTIGCIQGGDTFNVIPDYAKMLGTVRTYNKEVRDSLRKRMEEITEGIGQVFRAEAMIEWSDNYTIPLISDKKMAEEAIQSLRRIFPKEQVLKMQQAFPGSEDFAFIGDKVPSLFVVLGATVKEGIEYGQHHPKVQYNESCLPIGTAAFVQITIEWLKKNKKIERM